MESRVSLRTLILSKAGLIAGLMAGAFVPVTASPATARLPRESLYQVRSLWTDSSGATLSLRDLRGTPVVMAMMYPRCKYSCPLIIAKLKKIDRELAAKPALKFVLISFDQRHDSPELFRKFLQEKELDPARWKILGGKTSGGIRELATLLDTSYKLEADGEFSHSNVLTLLDADGVKRSTVQGLNADHSALVKAALELP